MFIVFIKHANRHSVVFAAGSVALTMAALGFGTTCFQRRYQPFDMLADTVFAVAGIALLILSALI
jgi:hypothetical protein